MEWAYQKSRSSCDSKVLFRDSDAADDNEHNEEANETPHVELASTNFAHENPGGDSTADTKSVLTHSEIERFLNGEAGLLKEIGGIAHET